jgi:glyoxylase-like metal-dependent hydrolase (beta-lactamase superfamily II)
MKQSLAALVLTSMTVPATAACDNLFDFKRVQASPHVVQFQTPEGTPGIVNGNTVAIIGKDAVLVVDPGQFPTTAKQIIAEIRAITKAPVTYVINTHWHGDHLLANSAYKEAFPGVKIVAHPHTIAEAAKYYDNYVPKTTKSIESVSDFFRKKRETAGEDEKIWIDATLECAKKFMPELARTTFVAPDTAFEKDFDVDLGGVTASVRHLGSGNTPGDLIVWVLQDRVVATGDIVVFPAPYAIGSNLKPWPDTIDRVLALNPAAIIPGHGPLMRDDGYVRDVKALVASIQAQIESMMAAGVSRADAPARLDTIAFRERYIKTPMQRHAFEQFFVRSAVAAAWPKDAPKEEADKPPGGSED